MGRDLFRKYPGHTRRASEILGYSIEQLCVYDPDNKLAKAQYAQPALYVTNALAYYEGLESGSVSDVSFLAGHSLGEYNALLAADVFSFEEGLELIKLCSQLTGEAAGGVMAIVVGVSAQEAATLLQQSGLSDVDMANYNTPTQSVLSGPADAIAAAGRVFAKAGARFVVLNVGAAFHSRYMQGAQDVFRKHLDRHSLRDPKIPVIANVNARPYENGKVAETLGRQVASPVLWMDSVIYLLAQGDLQYTEVGGPLLISMIDEIRKSCGAQIERLRRSQESHAPLHGPKPAQETYFEPW